MSAPELLALCGPVCLLVAVYAARRSLGLFVALGCGLLLCSAALLYMAESGSLGERLVVEAGLCLCWVGLLGLLAMLRRSVSLRLLADLSGGGGGTGREMDVGGRLNDCVSLGLVVCHEQGCRLTRLGRVIGALVRLSYVVTRAE